MHLPRLVKLVDIFHSTKGLTAERLAARLKVSRRTVFRDFEDLAQMGVPIVYDRDSAAFYLAASLDRCAVPLAPDERRAIARLLVDPRVVALHPQAVQAIGRLLCRPNLLDLAGRLQLNGKPRRTRRRPGLVS